MYLKFKFDSFIPKEFGENPQECVYYVNEQKITSVDTDESFDYLKNISKINLFVGANNSGKSRFLRGLLKIDYNFYEVSTSEKSIQSWTDLAVNWYNNNRIRVNNFDNSIGHKLDQIFNSLAIKRSDSYTHLTNNHDSFQKIIKNVNELCISYKKDIGYSGYKGACHLSLEFYEMVSKLGDEVFFASNHKGKYKVYVPILRSIKQSSKLHREAFKETIKELYDIPGDNIFTGLDLYDSVLEIRNNLKEHRKGFEEFETFLSKYFFNNKEVEIICDIKEKHIILYVGGEERKIHDVGDGIQSIILLLFPVYTAKNNTWIFIEEPETYLHPGLQRIFIETLIDDEYLNSKNLRYFFTTHSNHFLDLTIDSNEISIFQFKKESLEKFNIKTNVRPDKEVLDVLGVNTSSVFLANTSLWVEGPTDRKYLSRFLKLYCKYNNKPFLKEDIDFTFFEYGGNLIVHYLFENKEYEGDEEDVRAKINSFASSNRIYLLADEDGVKGNTKKGKRRLALETISDKNENFKYQNTKLKEIENLLPKKTIKNFINTLIKEENDIEKLESLYFKKADYDKIGIGKFYQDQFISVGIPSSKQKAFKADSGTLKNDYKIRLCNEFINSEMTYKELIDDNPILENIIKDLYDFISPNNKSNSEAV